VLHIRIEIQMPGSYMVFNLELEREEDGRWIAEVRELPGVMI